MHLDTRYAFLIADTAALVRSTVYLVERLPNSASVHRADMYRAIGNMLEVLSCLCAQCADGSERYVDFGADPRDFQDACKGVKSFADSVCAHVEALRFSSESFPTSMIAIRAQTFGCFLVSCESETDL